VTGCGDGIHATGGFIAYTEVRGALHQPGLFQPFKGGVDLGWFHLPGGVSADDGLERRPEFITVAGFLCKQTENGITDRHN
jgi:hypothetical protein